MPPETKKVETKKETTLFKEKSSKHEYEIFNSGSKTEEFPLKIYIDNDFEEFGKEVDFQYLKDKVLDWIKRDNL